MTRELTDAEVLATTEEMLAILREPDPDPMLFGLLYSLPLSGPNLAKVLGAVGTTAGMATLQAAGVDLDDPVERARFSVRTHTTMPADDTAGFELAAGELVNLGCAFVLADDDFNEAGALAAATNRIVARGPEFTFLTLGAVLSHIRRILHGDTRGVIRT
ncbi:hypothetical protein [Promicromonospora sp. NPDC050880]|uniref:hypothetical protein n=1 Tax=Promicromonospora sp. NPDC050880 TaxID=3364406 RepID=UPI0037B6E80C